MSVKNSSVVWRDNKEGFRYIASKTMIIRGQFALSDHRFGFLSRNKQSPACCIVASLYANVKPIIEWKFTDMNNILFLGDSFFRKSLFKMKRFNQKCVMPDYLHPSFFIGRTKFVTFLGGQTISYNSLSDSFEQTFEIDIVRLLDTTNAVILCFNKKNISIWTEGGAWYLFIPHDADALGNLTKIKQGTCCTIRYLCPKQLTKKVIQLTQGNITLYSMKILKQADFCIEAIETCTQNERPLAAIVHEPIELLNVENEPEEHPGISELIDFDEITNQKDIPNFPYVENGFASLHGTSYVKDPKQLFLTSISAIILLNQFKCWQWTKETINDILKMGRQAAVDNPSEVLRHIDLENRKTLLVIPLGARSFTIELKIAFLGDLTTQTDKNSLISRSINAFFQTEDAGLLKGPQTVAIWQENGIYFMFDPKERDLRGRKWTKILTDGQSKMKTSGGACLTSFKSLQNLINTYMGNINEKYQNDTYRIYTVHVAEREFSTENWFNWKSIDHNKWLLSSKISLCDYGNPLIFDNLVYLFCICTSIILSEKQTAVDEWSTETMDTFLNRGNDLYKTSVGFLGINEGLEINQIRRAIKINNKDIIYTLDECIVGGKIFTDEHHSENNLEKGIHEFFNKNKSGVFTCSNTCLALWERDENFYVFNPKGLGPWARNIAKCAGFELTDMGFPSVVKLEKISDLIASIHEDANIEPENEFCIARVEISIEALYESQFLKHFTPIPSFSKTPPYGLILRSSNGLYEGHSYFGRRANKQTLCNLLSALDLAHLISARNWHEEDLVFILRKGDDIYYNILTYIPQCEWDNYTATWDDIPGDMLKFEREEINGYFKRMVPSIPNTENMQREGDSEGEDLANAEKISEVFVEDPHNLGMLLKTWEIKYNIYAILESDFFIVSLWKQNGFYFVFDSKASDVQGKLSKLRLKIAEVKVKAAKAKENPEDDSENLESPVEEVFDTKEQDNVSAYVACFKTVDEIVNHLLEKLPAEWHAEPLKLNIITLTSKLKEIVGNEIKLNAFQSIESNAHWIMRATISQSDAIFKEPGKQGASNSVMAVSFAISSSSTKWSPIILDTVLKYGNRLHAKSLQAIEDENSANCIVKEYLNVYDVKSYFTVHKTKYNFEVLESVKFLLKRNSPNAPSNANLLQWVGKLETINGNLGAIFCLNTYFVAVWKDDGKIFIFDPEKTSPTGIPTSNGVACLSMLSDENQALKLIIAKLNCVRGSPVVEIFKISVVKQTPGSQKDLEQLGKIPALCKYSAYFEIGRGLLAIKCVVRVLEYERLSSLIAAMALNSVQKAVYWTVASINKIARVACRLANIWGVGKVYYDPSRPRIPLNFEIDKHAFIIKWGRSIRGNVFSKEPAKEITLLTGIKTLFADVSNIILILRCSVIALWQTDGNYFAFMYHSKEDTSYVLLSKSIEFIYDWILLNTEKPKSVDSYELHGFHIRVSPAYSKHQISIKNRMLSTKCPRGNKAAENNKLCMLCKCLVPDNVKPTAPCETEPVYMSCSFAVKEGKIITFCDLCRATYAFTQIQREACSLAGGVAQLLKITEWTPDTLEMIANSAVDLYKNKCIAGDGGSFEEPKRKQEIFFQNRNVNIITNLVSTQPYCRDAIYNAATDKFKNFKCISLTASYACCTLVVVGCNIYVFEPGRACSAGSAKENVSVSKFPNLAETVHYVLTNIFIRSEEIEINVICVNVN